MALSPAIGAHPLATSDLIIEIRPRFICRYYGTRAQLVAEGLIPAGLQWPNGRARANFSDARFDYWLERNRVPGTKGPVKSWIDGDYWVLDSTPKGQRMSWADRQIIEKQRELAELSQFNSPARQLQIHRAVAAKFDAAYQGFLTRALGDAAPRKRGRPAKAINTTQSTQSQGATA